MTSLNSNYRHAMCFSKNKLNQRVDEWSFHFKFLVVLLVKKVSGFEIYLKHGKYFSRGEPDRLVDSTDGLKSFERNVMVGLLLASCAS